MANGRSAADAKRSAAEAAVSASDQDVAKMREEYHEQTKGKPTPTQHELNLIKAGAPPEKKESDGAGNRKAELWGARTRQVEAGQRGQYQTRQAQPRPAAPAQPAQRPAPQRPAE
jgi:hypothetical protein